MRLSVTGLMVTAALALPLAIADGRTVAHRAQGGVKMSDDRLKDCRPTAATLTLVEEALLTRTAITAATAGNHARPVVIGAHDPRLTALAEALRQVVLAPARHAQFEPRTLLQLTCHDGRTLHVEGSATDPDGTMHLRVGDTTASTMTPLRRLLDAVAARAPD